jgi:CRISPR-associated protein Csm2
MSYYDRARPQQGGGRQPYGRQNQDAGPSRELEEILKQIDVANPSGDLFDAIAERAAEEIAKSAKAGKRDKNKSTQLRRFYDEIVMWDQRIRQLKEDERARVYGAQYLPLIKMLNAKAAYAESRELIDQNFLMLLRHGLRQLEPDKSEAFKNFKLFMEAFMGFYKLHNPK